MKNARAHFPASHKTRSHRMLNLKYILKSHYTNAREKKNCMAKRTTTTKANNEKRGTPEFQFGPELARVSEQE